MEFNDIKLKITLLKKTKKVVKTNYFFLYIIIMQLSED